MSGVTWVWIGFIAYMTLLLYGSIRVIIDQQTGRQSWWSRGGGRGNHKRRSYIYSNDDPLIPKGWIDHCDD
jgi:hypothetical protein